MYQSGMCGWKGVGRASCRPIFSNLRESWSKVCHAAGELATLFSLTLFCFLVATTGKLVKSPPPPTDGFLAIHCQRMLLFLVRACLKVYLPILVFKRFLSEVPLVCPGLFPDSLQNDDV